ncbi:MAG: zinc ABC transporter substrate-binding protein [Rhodobacteraceae bacterium]|nr:zinc ABC transporter substrate-binding protein [Paracoccaceae bacterium]
MPKPILPAAALCWLALPAMAETPKVIADIAPIQSLAQIVLGDLGTAELLVPVGASPHDFSFRPSEATALSQADLVIWMGADLTPWLADPIAALAPEADKLALLETTGWTPIASREEALFDLGGEADGHEHGAEHEHEDEHSHEEDHGHDDHGHDHGAYNPHAWLDPEIAGIWLRTIADRLADLDSENAEIYRANAARGQAEFADLTLELQTDLAGLHGIGYVVPHDAYVYFENRFDLPAAGAIAIGDASKPGPQRIAQLRDAMSDRDIRCVLTDLQTSPDWALLVTEGTQATIAQINDLGIGLEPGVGYYPALIRQIAETLTDCLNGN